MTKTRNIYKLSKNNKKFKRYNIYKVEKSSEKVILVGLQTKNKNKYDVEESLDELTYLSKTLNLDVYGTVIQRKSKPHPAYFIGSGKAKSISKTAKRNKVQTLIFDDDLTPSQERNLTKKTNLKIITRTQLILDIFARHASTKASALQIELAQLQYDLSRLKGQWTHLSRMEGATGARGPGEKQLEVDRRQARDRISMLKSKLDNIEQSTKIKRKRREKFFSVSMVGYTNAGKTTLLNKLTNSNKHVADELFATLETTSRKKNLSTNDTIILSDTIGFIRKLPHTLISSFHATLMEVIEADLLLHVIDITHPKIYEYIQTVFSTLEQIEADDVKLLMVFNKIDLLPRNKYLFLKKKLRLDYSNSVFVSAKEENNLDNIENYIEEILLENKKIVHLKIPIEEQKFLSFLYDNVEILEKRYNSNFTQIKIRIGKRLYKRRFNTIRKYQIKAKQMPSKQNLLDQ